MSLRAQHLISICIALWYHVATGHGAEASLLPLKDPVTACAMSEDGKYLVAAHESTNKITVCDVEERRLITTLTTPSPRHLLFRGTKVYAANYGKGTLSVFDSSQEWKLCNQVLVGKENVLHLAAPKGEYFKDTILACCDEFPKTTLHKIDVKKDSNRELPNTYRASTVNFSYDGKTIIEQCLVKPGIAGPTYEMTAGSVLAGKPDKPKHFGNDASYILQPRRGNVWFARCELYDGTPLKSKNCNIMGFFIPDYTRDVFYAVDNTTVTEYTTQSTPAKTRSWEVTLPKEYFKLSRLSAYRIGFAATHDKMIHAFIFDVEKTSLFHLGLNINDATQFETPSIVDTSVAQKNDTGTFPENVVESQPVTHDLYTPPVKGQYEVVLGPKDIKISEMGVLTWTPAKADIGEQTIKVRAEVQGKTSFIRLNTNVIAKEIANRVDGNLEKLDNLGTHSLSTNFFDLVPTHDNKAMLLIDGRSLKILDADGLAVLKNLDLENSFHLAGDRRLTTVLIGNTGAAILDKKTLKISKQFKLPGIQPTSLALHPGGNISYVAVYNDAGGTLDPISAKRIAVINEEKGTATLLPEAAGTWIAVNPNGQYLYSALTELYRKGVQLDLTLGQVMPAYGNIDMVVSYAIHGESVQPIQINFKAGTNGRILRIAPDGKNVAYASGGGYRAGPPSLNGYTVPSFRGEDITQIVTAYPIEAYPRDICYHPVLDLVAACNDNKIWMFERSSARPLPDKIDLAKKPFQTIARIFFSASGRYLIVDSVDSTKKHTLHAIPLQLSESEKQTIAEPRKEIKVLPSLSTAGGVMRGNLKRREPVTFSSSKLDALKRPHYGQMEPKEIAEEFMQSVVVIHSGSSAGTGFVVGDEGYIMTCAHVLEPGQPVTVHYVPKGTDTSKLQSISGNALYFDEDLDLALVKVDVTKDLHPVKFEKKSDIETGEAVSVIGHPGLGDTLLNYTMTQGIVSNPARPIDKMPYIQTTASINPGMSGGPMFNSKGNVIGLVVLKAAIENTGFAIPRDRLADFLEDCAKGKANTAYIRDTGEKNDDEASSISTNGESSLEALLQGHFNKPRRKSSKRTYLHILSAPNEYIGGGKGYEFKEKEMQFHGSADRLNVRINSDGQYWSLDAMPPIKELFEEKEYDNAQRCLGRNEFPGLSFSGHGRCHNTCIGRFVIWDLKIKDGVITRIAMDFIQSSRVESPPLAGKLRYNTRYD